MENEKTTPRIYVACLKAYNNGKLHGRWIDATMGADEIESEVMAMLATSPEPHAEEWAIHDCEGFGAFKIDEYESFETVSAIAEILSQENGKLILAFYENDTSLKVTEVVAAFEAAYLGAYDSIESYVEQLLEDTGALHLIPKHLQGYFDYQAYGRDLELGGDVWTLRLEGQLHIFNSNV